MPLPLTWPVTRWRTTSKTATCMARRRGPSAPSTSPTRSGTTSSCAGGCTLCCPSWGVAEAVASVLKQAASHKVLPPSAALRPHPNRPAPKECVIPQAALDAMRSEFEFWYPFDLRVSGAAGGGTFCALVVTPSALGSRTVQGFVLGCSRPPPPGRCLARTSSKTTSRSACTTTWRSGVRTRPSCPPPSGVNTLARSPWWANRLPAHESAVASGIS
jgi:hypothetical protein